MDSFIQRKKDVLKKLDKSSIGKWDKKIVSLCNKINSKKDFYTTSSCSGRIVVMKDKTKKGPGLFEFVSHDEVGFEEFMEVLKFFQPSPRPPTPTTEKIKQEKSFDVKNLNLKFKVDPPIIHIVCRDLNSAKKILNKGRIAGFKRSGILSMEKIIVVELNSTEKLEFPIAKKGEILVDSNFLKIVLQLSNKKLKKGWEKIDKFEKSLDIIS